MLPRKVKYWPAHLEFHRVMPRRHSLIMLHIKDGAAEVAAEDLTEAVSMCALAHAHVSARENNGGAGIRGMGKRGKCTSTDYGNIIYTFTVNV